MTVPEATDTTEHILSVEWSNGYRAICSCGYRSRRYAVLTATAKRAWEAHVRAAAANSPDPPRVRTTSLSAQEDRLKRGGRLAS